MTIFWSSFAIATLQEVYEFNKVKSVNTKAANRLVHAIVQFVTKLEKHPYIGQVEHFLSDRPEGFRYIVYKNYKIIYWVNVPLDRIEISYVFDSRQRPSTLGRLK